MNDFQCEVGIIMGSDSDFKIMKNAVLILEQFGIGYEVLVSSAHRTTDEALNFASTADERGLKVIIAGAGAAAHLPGVLAAKTVLPVIGVPINATSLNGLDALYAIVQMPSGIPVATVAIDGAANAALLAIEILAISNIKLKNQLLKFREDMKNKVSTKNNLIQEQIKEIKEKTR